MARMPKPVIPEPKAHEFDVESEWHYAMSVWHEDNGRVAYANLHMQMARYHQEKEYADAIQNRYPSLRQSLRPGSAANSVGMNRDPELAHHEDAAMVAKILYLRGRARSPLSEYLPIWKNLSPGSQSYLIDDVKEAIRVLDERRNNRKA